MLQRFRGFNKFQKLADEVNAAHIGDISRERVSRQVELLQLIAVLIYGFH